jgi:hypothetical protein
VTAWQSNRDRLLEEGAHRAECLLDVFERIRAGESQEALAHASERGSREHCHAGLAQLEIYWSSLDTVVGDQTTKQSGKFYNDIIAIDPNAARVVTQVVGDWAHSTEFVPGDRLSDALRDFQLI